MRGGNSGDHDDGIDEVANDRLSKLYTVYVFSVSCFWIYSRILPGLD